MGEYLPFIFLAPTNGTSSSDELIIDVSMVAGPCVVEVESNPKPGGYEMGVQPAQPTRLLRKEKGLENGFEDDAC